MKNLILILIVFLGACTSPIKNEKTKKATVGEEILYEEQIRPIPTQSVTANDAEDLIGYWVGWFQPDLTKDQRKKHQQTGYRPVRNKINISIDKITSDSVFGHSVVANNNRPFRGVLTIEQNQYQFQVYEPGDDKYDGVFHFSIGINESDLKGDWFAFDSNLNVPKRKYSLKKKLFTYNPGDSLDYSYQDWSKTVYTEIKREHLVKLFGSEKAAVLEMFDLEIDSLSPEELEEYTLATVDIMNEGEGGEVYSVSPKVFEFNSSRDALTSEYISELSKADIYILRNSIFARHGYSFKKRDLRSYFEQMEWYIPVHADIKTDLTEIEKINIELLLAYEEHAEEYYDAFGR